MAEMMRNHRRWVTWMAALMIAAGLVALPNAGTAFPIRAPEGSPYQFGEPDEPMGRAREVWPGWDWLKAMRFRSWLDRRLSPIQWCVHRGGSDTRLTARPAKH